MTTKQFNYLMQQFSMTSTWEVKQLIFSQLMLFASMQQLDAFGGTYDPTPNEFGMAFTFASTQRRITKVPEYFPQEDNNHWIISPYKVEENLMIGDDI